MDPIAVLALAVAGWAAVVARTQLKLQRDSAGGHGIRFDLSRTTHLVVNGDPWVVRGLHVELHGPGIRYEVAVHLERDGRQIDELDAAWVDDRPTTRKVMTCEDEPIRWDIQMSEANAAGVWCLVSWVEARGDVIFTHAYARNLVDPKRLFVWRWYRLSSARRWLQGLNLRTRPLGRWDRVNARYLDEGQGPFDLGRRPDARRRSQ
jgi:hypothetical protein